MIVVVASSSLWPTPALASAVLVIMLDGDKFLIRRPAGYGYSSAIEEMVAKIGQRIGREVTAFPPEHGGREGVYRRDVAMVRAADHVYAFFAPGEVMVGGTGHVVACALRDGKPVDAYQLDDDGNVVEIGSDPGDLVQMFEGSEWSS